MKSSITMKDIADKLGVSSVTVSKALNDKDGVSESLKLKIKKVAGEMGYRFNSAAKSIRDGLSYNIGIMIPQRFTGMNESFYLQVYQQIAIQLDHYGYFGIMNILSDEDEKQLNFPRIYNENRVDGIIFLGQICKKYIEIVQNMDLPKIFLDFYDEHADIDSIISDNFYGAYEITNYLIQCGHRDIAYVGNIYSTSSIQDRFLGYYKSLLEHGLVFEDRLLLKDRDEFGKYIEFQYPEKMPTAFVCNCDQVAYNLCEDLASKGYRVPKDCSVVGFDNDIYATLTSPPLTTVEVDIEQMAKTAVKVMMDKVANPNRQNGRMLVPGKIIYRDSVKTLDSKH